MLSELQYYSKNNKSETETIRILMRDIHKLKMPPKIPKHNWVFGICINLYPFVLRKMSLTYSFPHSIAVSSFRPQLTSLCFGYSSFSQLSLLQPMQESPKQMPLANNRITSCKYAGETKSIRSRLIWVTLLIIKIPKQCVQREKAKKVKGTLQYVQFVNLNSTSKCHFQLLKVNYETDSSVVWL